jgi:hypothetical protein
MALYITTYNGKGTGVFDSETRDQAINTVYETLKASGSTPDRRLINAWPVRKKKRQRAH